MRHKEYGGYIELDYQTGKELHESAIALNCGRNCLAYLIEVKNIKKLYLPYFLCASVVNTCKKYNVEVEYYRIDETFRPIFEKKLGASEYLYLVNYYGQFTNDEIVGWKQRYPNLIVDNAQAYFQMPAENVDTLYTCRKYFGVADGAYLYTDVQLDREIELDYSYKRMNFLLGRFEKGANEFYSEYVANNSFFRDEPIKQMSKLTHNLLRGIDYARVRKIRTQNFAFLHEQLKQVNQLDLGIPEGAFMYPLYIKGGAEIRKSLQQKKIYIPILWPDVFDICDEMELEYDMAKNVLPIPVDQRYGIEDMKYLIKEVQKIGGSLNDEVL